MSFLVWSCSAHSQLSVVITDLGSLASLGYKQELRRHYSTVEIFAVAFSIMGLLPSIASTLSFSMPAGPVGMVWVNLSVTLNEMNANDA